MHQFHKSVRWKWQTVDLFYVPYHLTLTPCLTFTAVVEFPLVVVDGFILLLIGLVSAVDLIRSGRGIVLVYSVHVVRVFLVSLCLLVFLYLTKTK